MLEVCERELQSNRDLLVSIHDRNAALVAALTNAGEDETPTGDFLPGVQISDSAWRVLGATGLVPTSTTGCCRIFPGSTASRTSTGGWPSASSTRI